MLDQDLINWLLDGPPWVQYRTRIDLLGEVESSPQVTSARGEMVDHPLVQGLIDDLGIWPDPPLKRHNDAKHPIHKLDFLADIGLRESDPGMRPIIKRILANQSEEGPFQIVMNLHPRFGGRSGDHLVWMLCDAPVVLYGLIKLGLADHPQIQSAGEYLMASVRENGWPCQATAELGNFKGPGQKDDPCPYANLVMLRALAEIPEWHDSEACISGADTLLNLWERRREVKPFLFAMGTHFSRLKLPMIWYDILHVVDVLSRFPWAVKDARFEEMVEIILAKADSEGRFVPESVWMAWKDWDFGQKKSPSPWLTFVTYRMLRRIQAADMM